jgi:Icc-related predicted phosphoesterase
MRAIWLTDLHLNFVPGGPRRKFYETLRAAQADVILLGGDIAEAPSLAEYLSELEVAVEQPIYFVLGNHDFYHSSFAAVRREVKALVKSAERLVWLTTVGVVPLTETTALIGHDSWADGRLGDGASSGVMLNDFLLIKELRTKSQAELFARLGELGDRAAKEAEANLCQALARYRRVIFLTHVPPFREACWHEGRISDNDFLPHFTCKAMGEMLARRMAEHPDRELTVLCGHTHGQGVARIGANILVRTGGAEYGRPAIQDVLEL